MAGKPTAFQVAVLASILVHDKEGTDPEGCLDEAIDLLEKAQRHLDRGTLDSLEYVAKHGLEDVKQYTEFYKKRELAGPMDEKIQDKQLIFALGKSLNNEAIYRRIRKSCQDVKKPSDAPSDWKPPNPLSYWNLVREEGISFAELAALGYRLCPQVVPDPSVLPPGVRIPIGKIPG